MGEYEERYPDAYGRSETATRPTAAQGSETTHEPPRQSRDRSLFSRLGSVAVAESSRGWQHSRAKQEAEASLRPPPGTPVSDTPVSDEIAVTSPPSALHRGRGPRGYVRTADRILEDLCDRLTENPFVDASDIEVSVSGSEVILEGTVDSDTAYRQTQAIAEEIIGVSHVRNHLAIRPNGET
jgi:osmotically-inducible protein OsmY